jgi:DNA-binding winged helix-turn-helix (wHTH) protein/Tol biopolymer transport system component
MPAKPDVTYFGPFAFDLRRQELTKRGHRIRMPASQLRLLNLFLQRPGELITRDEIMAALWVDNSNIDVATGINTAIKRLRQSLSDFTDAPECIETVIGVGYRFVAELQEVSPAQPPPADLQTKTPAPSQAPPNEAMEAGEAGFVALDALEGLPTVSSSPPTTGLSSSKNGIRFHRWRLATAMGCLIALVSAGTGFLYRLQGKRSSIVASTTQPQSPQIPSLSTWEGQLDKITTAAMSPDGRGVAYSNSDGVSLHWFGRAEQLLSSLPPIQTDHISWLPDNELLLTGTNKQTQRHEVWAVPIMGWLPILVLQDADNAVASPDGAFIAYTREHGRQIWIATATGKDPRRLTTDTSGHFAFIAWAPSGDHLLVEKEISAQPSSSHPISNASASYESIDATSGAVLDREANVPFVSGYVLADGRLYFPVEVKTSPFERSAQLMLVKTDPRTGRFLGKPVASQDLAGNVTSLSASLDGKELAFILDRPVVGLMVADVHLPGPSLGNVHQVPSTAKESYPHAWTADGSAILLERELLHRFAIYQQPLDGVGATVVANLPDSIALAQVTPDGRWILFLRIVGKTQEPVGIFRVPALGGNPQQVPTTGKLDNVRCSTGSSGRCVVREAIANIAMTYSLLDPITGMGRELTRTPWKPRILGDWDISPDGKTAAVADHDEDRPQVQLVDLDSSPAKITDIPVPGHGTVYEAAWAADGASLFVETRTTEGFELLYVDLAGHITLLRKSQISIWAVPSRDGKKLAFPGLSTSRNVWTLAASR